MFYSALHRLQISHWVSKKLLTDKFSVFRLLYRLLSKLNFQVAIRRNGTRQRVPILEGMGFTNLLPDYERWLDRLLPEIIQTDSPVILDVGANTGQTLLKVKSVFPLSHYLGVEPNIYCVKYLEKLIEVNGFEKTTIFPNALSDAVEEMTLQIRYKDDLLATTTPEFRKFTRYDRSLPVRAMTGDEILAKNGIQSIDLLKVDVEGGENKVLKGLEKSIMAHRPYILCEILPLQSKSEEVAAFRRGAAESILNLCRQLNYNIFNVATGLPVSKIIQLSDSLENSNYLFVPTEKSHKYTQASPK